MVVLPCVFLPAALKYISTIQGLMVERREWWALEADLRQMQIGELRDRPNASGVRSDGCTVLHCTATSFRNYSSHWNLNINLRCVWERSRANSRVILFQLPIAQ